MIFIIPMNAGKYFIAILLLIPSLVSAQATKQELKICKAIDERTAAATELLKMAVNLNSGTMNFTGVRKVGDLFGEKLRALGFETRWVMEIPFIVPVI